MYTKLSHNDYDYKRVLSDFAQIKDSNKYWGVYQKSTKKILIEPSFENQPLDTPEIFYVDKPNNDNTFTREYVIVAKSKWGWNNGLVNIATGERIVEYKYTSIVIDDSGIAICTSKNRIYLYNIFTKNGICCRKYKNGLVYTDKSIMSNKFEVIQSFDELWVFDAFSIFRHNGRYGIIDDFGTICFGPQDFPIIDVTENYVVIVKEGKAIGAVDYNGNIVFPFVTPNDLFDEENFRISELPLQQRSSKLQLLPTGYAIIRFQHGWDYSIYNSQNEIVGDVAFFEEYEIIGEFIVIRENKYSNRTILDMHGRHPYDEYNNSLSYIGHKGKYIIVKGFHGMGVINDKGHKLIPCKYKDITIKADYSVWGKYVIDSFYFYNERQGEWSERTIDVHMTLNYEHIVECSCGTTLYIKDYDAACEIENVGIKVYKGKKEGLIGYDKNIILPAIFESISPQNNIIFITLNGKTGLFDIKNGFLTKLEYASIEYICNNRFVISYEKIFADTELSLMDGFSFWGMIDLYGNMILPVKYESIKCLSDNDDTIKPLFSIRISGMEQLCDYNGNIISNNKFQHIHSFHEGMAGVKVRDRWGYIDNTGSIVISPIYNRVTPFEEGKASVESNDKTYILDKSGTCLMAFDYIEKDKFFNN